MIRAGRINSVVALGNFRVVLKRSAQSFFRKLHKSNPSYAMRIAPLQSPLIEYLMESPPHFYAL